LKLLIQLLKKFNHFQTFSKNPNNNLLKSKLYLNKLSNTAETLKFKKDSELETPILNTEGVEKWTDLLDKDRFNLNAKSNVLE
jgi:hypothetical protein